MMLIHLLVALCFVTSVQPLPNQSVLEETRKYLPDWESLDTRKLPEWYQDAKIGIFIHWGIYSVPSFRSEWFWYQWKTETSSRSYRDFMEKNYKPGFTYQDFARDFTAEFYNATEWAKLFESAGAKYVVLTSKHHEGFTLWPSKNSFGWNAMDVGPHRDLVGELANAVRANTDLRFGVYHSLFEWFNPLFLEDQANNFATDKFVQNKVLPDMYDLVERYKPEVWWSDGSRNHPIGYWKSKEFIAYLYNDSPVKDTIVINDRWGYGTGCKHGDFFNCRDKYNPGKLMEHKWENALTIDKNSWGYRRHARLEDYMTTAQLLKELASTVSCNGNILINVGPTKDGVIAPIYQERLKELGGWLKINGEAIYGSRPWRVQNDTITGDTWYTASKDMKTLYAIVLTWPEDDVLYLGALDLSDDYNYTFSILSYSEELKWRKMEDRVEVDLPLRAHKNQLAWVVKIKSDPESSYY